MDGKMKKSIVELAKERMAHAKEYYSYSRELSLDDVRFVMGDSDNMYQWPDEIMRYGDNNKVRLTINLTAQHCNAVTNNVRMNRPQVKVLPVDDFADKEVAEIIGGWIRSVQSYSNADDAHDNAMEYSVWGGEGYWRITLDYENEDSFTEIPYIEPINDFSCVYIDPFAQKPDKSDAEWGMIAREMKKEVFEEKFPKASVDSWPVDNKWVKKDSVVVADYYYCENKDDVLEQYEDGTTGYKSDNKDTEVIINGAVMMQPSKMVAIGNDGKPISRKTTRKQWKHCILGGGEDKPLESRDWPGSYLPIIGVYGKQYNLDGNMVYKGLVRDVKDPARMVNYHASAATETVALQTKIPYIASVEATQGHEAMWDSANVENFSRLPYNEFNGQGERITQPRRAEPAVVPVAQIQMYQLAVGQMKEASGQHNAVFGVQGNESSGIAIQRRKQQGETATFHFPDNLTRALRYEAQVLIDLMPKIMTERQIIRMLGVDGSEEKAVLMPDLKDESGNPIPYQKPNKAGKAQGIKAIFNPNAGKYDVAITTGASYATQRQEGQDFVSNIIKSDPTVMQRYPDLVYSSFDFPNSQAWVDRAKKMLPPELQEESEEEIPPQVKAQLDQLAGELEQSQMALEDAANKLKKLEMEKEQAKKEQTIAQIEAKEAKSILSIKSAEQQLAAKMPQEKDDDDGINPDMEEILFRMAEQEAKQDATLDGIYQMLQKLTGAQQ